MKGSNIIYIHLIYYIDNIIQNKASEVKQMLLKTASKKINATRTSNNLRHTVTDFLGVADIDPIKVTRKIGDNLSKEDIKYLKSIKKNFLKEDKDHFKYLRKSLSDGGIPYVSNNGSFKNMDRKAQLYADINKAELKAAALNNSKQSSSKSILKNLLIENKEFRDKLQDKGIRNALLKHKIGLGVTALGVGGLLGAAYSAKKKLQEANTSSEK